MRSGETTISPKMDYKEVHLRCLCPCVVTVLSHAHHIKQQLQYKSVVLTVIFFSVLIVISRKRPKDTSLFKFFPPKDLWDRIISPLFVKDGPVVSLLKEVNREVLKLVSLALGNSNRSYYGSDLH